MDLDNNQFGKTKITRTSKARDVKYKNSKLSLITDTESMQHGNNPPMTMAKPSRMSGAGTAKEMGELFKGIAAMKPKDK